ncbi:hypothetical protein M413DRAFT_28089 [Hebeloma cylindrosporum]|uniref:Uncharacterized protein n=1 Tax=Hebeloma cylindrosporum TaxID=76867 RepID=A0A0C3BWK3_HEBCY|nr:hypothetical protein M413DRAFT_28089 [Hebeloma cylindrosporum h7]
MNSGGSLIFTNIGPRMIPGSWCSNCNNGGTVVLCTICDVISICTACLDFVGQEETFTCPACFLKVDKFGKYPYTFCAVTSSRQIWPKMIISPLVIISIHLEGMSDIPSLLTYHHIRDWLRGNVVHIDLDFNFDDVPHNDFETRLNNMLDAFDETGEFWEWSQFMVIVTTHSDPTNGFLHIGPNNVGSVPVQEMLEAIFTDRFQTVLCKSKKNVLSLISCGALSSYTESRDQIKTFVDLELFEKVLCFSQPNFQPSATHKFMMDWAVSHFVFERLNISSFLSDHQSLGAHTDIVQFQPGNTTTFRWTHPSIRPFGIGISKQCPGDDCKRLKTRLPKKCKDEAMYTLPEDWDWVDKYKDDQGGAWLFLTKPHVKVTENANKMDVDT